MPITKKLVARDFKNLSFTPKQKEYKESIFNNTITFCWGPAGSSKTFSACYAALRLLEKGEVEKIICTKPIKEAGEFLGSLPGDVWEKISPHMESFITTMEKIISKEKLGSLINEGKIEFKPIAYLRGGTMDDSVMILDEAQNCDMKQIMLYVTRMGRGTKVIVAGDVTQHDIRLDKVALPHFIKMVRGIDSIGFVEFDENDIVRAEILREIVKRYEEWRSKRS